MAMLDATIVNVALVDMRVSLGATLAGLTWIVDGYALSFAALLILGGAMADRFGAKRVYMSGLAIFVLSSAACGLASSTAMLVAARIGQGVGAACFMPSSLSLLTFAFEEPRQRTKMIGIWGASVSAAMALGPCIGGVLIEWLGWRGIFLINLPIGVVGLWLSRRALPDSPRKARALRPGGHLLGAVALAAFSYVMIEGAPLGWTSPRIVTAVLVTAVAVALFVFDERRAARTGTAILPGDMLRDRAFRSANAIGMLINFTIFAQLFLISLYLQQRLHTSAADTGYALFPLMAMFALGNLNSARLSSRLGLRGTLLAGLGFAAVMSAVATALMFRGLQVGGLQVGGLQGFVLLAVFMALANTGIGAAIPAMNLTVMQGVGKLHPNTAAATLNANRQVGALTGVAVASIVLHAVGDEALAMAVGLAIQVLACCVTVGLAARENRAARTQGS